METTKRNFLPRPQARKLEDWLSEREQELKRCGYNFGRIAQIYNAQRPSGFMAVTEGNVRGCFAALEFDWRPKRQPSSNSAKLTRLNNAEARVATLEELFKQLVDAMVMAGVGGETFRHDIQELKEYVNG